MTDWKEVILARAVPAAAAVAGAGALVIMWQGGGRAASVPKRVPVERIAAADGTSEASPFEKGDLRVGEGTAAERSGSWPGFRGPGRDGISREKEALAASWDEGGPPELWAVEVGEGYAGAAVRGGRVYVMDYDREDQADALRCLSLADGREIWRFSYPVTVKRNHGMSRTVPAVTERFVVAMGPKCHVICNDAVTGEFRWGIDLVHDHGTTVPPWYAGQCPLIEDGRVILAPAGECLMMAVDCGSGKVLWKTPNPRGWKMTHVSVTPMEAGGERTYVYCGHRGVAAVSAKDGELLWDSTEWRISLATVASPVPLPDGRLFLSGGYNAGSLMMQAGGTDGSWSAAPVYRLDDGVFGATQQTPIYHEWHIYGVRPNGELVCLDPGGEVLWASGMDHRFGLGPFVVADGKIFVMDDHGKLTMAEAAPQGFRLLGEAKVLDGHDSWGPMAVAGGRLIARDLTRMACFDLRKK